MSNFAGYADLEFDLPEALLRAVVTTFEAITPTPLAYECLADLPDAQGVYQLLHNGRTAYVGKTDGDAGLRRRLIRHGRKIQHRLNLDPEAVQFKAVRIYVFTAVDIETDLIRHFGVSGRLPWNGSGFGSNDPGRERDTTKNKPTNFDALYPIDVDRKLELVSSSDLSASDALQAIQRAVPYKIRPQRASKGGRIHPDLETTNVVWSPDWCSARQAIAGIVGQLPSGWQATRLLGYVIIYKEERSYPDAEVLAST